MPAKRNLFLHLSALSDTEYSTYLDALRDILDDPQPTLSDDDLERATVGLPVVRAWMKGRFRDLGPPQIDKVLQLFASQVSANEMSGGQFLAALRLLMHVRLGRDASEGNVFIQANPSSPTTSRFSPPAASATPTFASERPTPDIPTVPSSSSPSHANPFFADFQNANGAGLPPPSHPSSDSPRRASLSSAPAPPPASSKPHVEGIGVPSGSTNPFLQRAKTHSGTYEPGRSGRTPPLPPRKPSHISSSSVAPHKPPPVPAKLSHAVTSRQNLSSNSASTSSSSPQSAPTISSHRVTPLMQQSLLASRVGATLKRAQEEAGRTRVLEVIRSSADVSVSPSFTKQRDRTQSSSRSPEKPGGRRPVPLPPRAITMSAAKSDSGAPSEASLAEIASARVASHTHTRTRSDSPDRVSLNSSSSESGEGVDQRSVRSRQLSSDQFSPPPTHPARRPSARSSSGRSRHIRSPSYQFNNSPHAPTVSKSIFSSETHDQDSLSSSTTPSPISPMSSRPMRSQSMHQPSPSTPGGRLSGQDSSAGTPLPPPQRKRPESVQFPARQRLQDSDDYTAADTDSTSPFSNSFGIRRNSGEAGEGFVSSIASRFEKPTNLGREREKEWDKDREQNAFASLKNTFNALQQRAQPTITRARFKAEASLLAPRRGFVPNGRDYHMAGEDGDRLVSRDDTGDEGGMDFGPGVDQDDDDEVERDDTIRGRGAGRERSNGTKDPVVDRDVLKLPEGEGWTRL